MLRLAMAVFLPLNATVLLCGCSVQEKQTTDLLPQLLEEAKSPDAQVRAKAISRMRFYKNEKVLFALSTALKDSDNRVKIMALWSIDNIARGPYANRDVRLVVEQNLRLLLRDKDDDVRKIAFSTAIILEMDVGEYTSQPSVNTTMPTSSR